MFKVSLCIVQVLFKTFLKNEVRDYFSQTENLPILEDLCNVIRFRLGNIQGTQIYCAFFTNDYYQHINTNIMGII